MKDILNKKNVRIGLYTLIAIIGLFVNELFVKQDNITLYNIILTVSVTLLITVIISFVDDTFFVNEIEVATQRNIESATETFSVLKDCHSFGLGGIYEKFPVDIKEIKNDFINSQSVHIVMNDGKAFFSNNRQLFLDRVAEDNLLTAFIVQDYRQEDIMSTLTRKNGHDSTPNYYVEKIKEFLSYHIKKDLFKNKSSTHKLEVYLNSNYNTLAMILTDNFAMYSVYRVSSGKTYVPHYVFNKESKEYDSIKADIENIKKNNTSLDIASIGANDEVAV